MQGLNCTFFKQSRELPSEHPGDRVPDAAENHLAQYL